MDADVRYSFPTIWLLSRGVNQYLLHAFIILSTFF